MKYRCYTKTFHSSLEDRPLLWSNMADPIWPILEVFSHFLNFDLHFFPNGGTSQNFAYAETKYKCYSKTFHASLEGWPLSWSNMANPIWPRIKDSVVGAHFKPLLLTRPLSADYCLGTNWKPLVGLSLQSNLVILPFIVIDMWYTKFHRIWGKMSWGLIFRQACHIATTTTLLLNYFSVDYCIISIRFHTSGCYISLSLQIKWHWNSIFSKFLPPERLQRSM